MEKKKHSAFLTWLSILYVAGAMCLLLVVCTHCYPQAEAYIRQAVAGLEDSPVRSAFAVLTQELQEGTPVAECLADSCEVLFGET